EGDLEPLQVNSGISLLFAPGDRPSTSDLEHLLLVPGHAGQGARIGHRPPDDHGWLELLASGLTFDVSGLAPGAAAPMPHVGQVHDLPADVDSSGCEAISIMPGAHIAAGGALMPVLRAMMGLAADLVLQLRTTAVCWNPACIWMAPGYFSRLVVHWLAGGPFPALGLTGLRCGADGVVASSGLAFFIGQEIAVTDRKGAIGSETMQLAARIVEHLVGEGPVSRHETLRTASGEVLALEPSQDGRTVAVSRGL
ncbi:MAG: hypothetical protein LBV50_05155, partial [Novosphingobium sp.]|nr:hypothetical protein [Novosphingobium sp.]